MRIPEESKKVNLSLTIDPDVDKILEKIIFDKKFYKKSRFVEFLIKKYAEENDYKFTIKK